MRMKMGMRMRIMNRISLRMRITLLSGAILLICSILLTIGASYNAQSQFNRITLDADQGSYRIESGIAEGEVKWLSPEEAFQGATTAPILTEAKKQFDMVNIVILTIVSVLGMGMVYAVAGRSLRPIHSLSGTISAISEDNLRERVPDDGRNDEVSALGHSFNIMLDRLERSFLRQKQFSANAAHELKTPLATINAGIQVLNLEENPTITDYKETVETVGRNVNRLMKVVDDLLNLYEQEEFTTVPIDLQDMFTSIFHELCPVLEGKHVEMELRCGLKTVHGNPVLLYRACFNLVENAAKYNKDGGRILIETKKEKGTGRIIISDTGYGIPPGELRQIFEPFHRVSKSRSRKSGGAGLGLSIVKAVIEKHGWKISVDSQLGQGSAFTITFAS